MTDTARLITIADIKQSQSGKTLGIRDNQGNWYTTKCWDLQQLVGHEIEAMTSTSDFNGRTITWINDYHTLDGPGQPIGVPRAPQKPALVRSPQTPVVDRDASIVAQTLCKACEFANPDQAWAAYRTLYARHLAWQQAGCPAQNSNPAPEPQQPEFNDDIPF